MSSWAVLLAAGSGVRLGQRKQFLQVGGQRAVDRVVRAAAGAVQGIVLVLPADVVWDGPPVDVVVAGGATRAQSVRAGLAKVPPTATVVVIHDAAHPLAAPELFMAVAAQVRLGADAAMCVLPMTEVVTTVRAGTVVDVLSKADQFIGQSPAAFRPDVLRLAHAGDPSAVEDVGLVVASGARVVAVAGDPRNVHITTELEWRMADALAPLADLAEERGDRTQEGH